MESPKALYCNTLCMAHILLFVHAWCIATAGH